MSTTRFDSQHEQDIFSVAHNVHTGCGAHHAPYPWNTGVCFPGGKAAGAWSWSFCLVPRSIVELYFLPASICHRGIVLNYIIKYEVDYTFHVNVMELKNSEYLAPAQVNVWSCGFSLREAPWHYPHSCIVDVCLGLPVRQYPLQRKKWFVLRTE
jgi:hypothetical protein